MNLSEKINNKKPISISDLLSEQNFKVVIPMIQRDYAQGRVDKGFIRESILESIYNAVKDNKMQPMQFVYGYKSNNIFYPLDGQQRLTTLWLVYWYLSLRANKLGEEKENLLRFSYETRKSSREFCEQLCKYKDIDVNYIIDSITNQRDFFEKWKDDPTINSMLRMIGGDNDKDGIHPVFKDIAANSIEFAEKLELFKKNVQFYVLILGSKELPIKSAEQLYVKMNARGKALTDFENFKVDLVNKMLTDETFDEDISLDGKTEKASLFFSGKIDNDWNDIFWTDEIIDTHDGNTDELFFAFIQRYCANLKMVAKNANGYDIDLSLAKLIEAISNPNDKVLSVRNAKKIENATDSEKSEIKKLDYLLSDTQISYEKFDAYEDLLKYAEVVNLGKVFEGIDKHEKQIDKELYAISQVIKNRLKDSESETYTLLPRLSDKKHEDKAGNSVYDIEPVTNKWRLYFHAVCKYLVKANWDESLFADWMRVVRNIVENVGIDDVSAMISCIRTIEEWGNHSDDILSYLNDETLKESSNPLTKLELQKNEEIEKAIAIKNVYAKKDEILEIEKYGSLCGCIRFLFTKSIDDGKPKISWTDFSTKAKIYKEYFPEDKGSKDYIDKRTIFAKRFASSFKDFADFEELDCMMFHLIDWQHRGDSWLDLLCGYSPVVTENAHKVLTVSPNADFSPNYSGKYRDFIESVFEILARKEVDSMVIIDKDKKRKPNPDMCNLRIAFVNDKTVVCKKSAQLEKLILDTDNFKRNELLNSLSKESGFNVHDRHILGATKYYWGDKIYFTYNNKDYVWGSDDKIYRCSENKKSKDPIVEKASEMYQTQILAKLDADNS